MNKLNKNSRVLVTGITSIHGWPIYKHLLNSYNEDQVFGIRSPKMTVPKGKNIIAACITDRKCLLKIKDDFKPTHIVHCAGVCDLDVCEERPNWAYTLNVGGTQAVIDVFGLECYILYLSTDLVFSGIAPPETGYTEEHIPDPIHVTGKTFLLAETEINKCHNNCIVRLGLPLGDSVTGDKGAIDWMENRFKRNLPVTLFFDEWRSCPFCDEIGEYITKLLNEKIEGLFHFGGKQVLSLYEIGQYVLNKGNYNPRLLNGIYRHEEKDGPPRIGNVALNSSKINAILN